MIYLDYRQDEPNSYITVGIDFYSSPQVTEAYEVWDCGGPFKNYGGPPYDYIIETSENKLTIDAVLGCITRLIESGDMKGKWSVHAYPLIDKDADAICNIGWEFEYQQDMIQIKQTTLLTAPL